MSSNNKLARQRWGAASLLPDTTEAKTKKPAIKDNATDVGHSTNARSKDASFVLMDLTPLWVMFVVVGPHRENK